jgi:hypothetical protein
VKFITKWQLTCWYSHMKFINKVSKSKSRYDWRSVSTSCCQAHRGTWDQILILSESCCLVSAGRLLWRKIGPVSCIRKFKVTLRLRCRAPLWDLRPDVTSCRNVAVWNLRSRFCGGPFWREDGSAICSVITQWSELHRTRNHVLLSHLSLSEPGGPGSRN